MVRCFSPLPSRCLISVSVVLALVACDRTVTSSAQGATANDDTGQLLWSAFQCAAYAALSGNRDQQARLFSLGYERGKQFIDGVQNKTISEEEIDNVPIGVIGTLAGPTTDFILGRIYEVAGREAYDWVVKKDSSGIERPMKEWVLDREVQEIRASTQFHTRNCGLLK